MTTTDLKNYTKTFISSSQLLSLDLSTNSNHKSSNDLSRINQLIFSLPVLKLLCNEEMSVLLLKNGFSSYEMRTIHRALVSYLFISLTTPLYEREEYLYKNHHEDNRKRGIPHTIPNKAKYRKRRRNNVKEGVS